jgi:hypothetical protein
MVEQSILLIPFVASKMLQFSARFVLEETHFQPIIFLLYKALMVAWFYIITDYLVLALCMFKYDLHTDYIYTFEPGI